MAKKIIRRLYVGNKYDWEKSFCEKGFEPKKPSLLLAAKTYHQKYLGYTRSLPKNHPEYLVAKFPQKRTMALNIIDVDEVGYIDDIIINTALNFVNEQISNNHNVLICCDQGHSRAPSIAFIYLISIGKFQAKEMTFTMAMDLFKKNYYRDYNPKNGILDCCRRYFYKINMEEQKYVR